MEECFQLLNWSTGLDCSLVRMRRNIMHAILLFLSPLIFKCSRDGRETYTGTQDSHFGWNGLLDSLVAGVCQPEMNALKGHEVNVTDLQAHRKAQRCNHISLVCRCKFLCHLRKHLKITDKKEQRIIIMMHYVRNTNLTAHAYK